MNCVDCGTEIIDIPVGNTRCHDCFKDHTDLCKLGKRVDAIKWRLATRKKHVAENKARRQK